MLPTYCTPSPVCCRPTALLALYVADLQHSWPCMLPTYSPPSPVCCQPTALPALYVADLQHCSRILTVVLVVQVYVRGSNLMLVACHQYVCQCGVVYPTALLQASMFCVVRPHRQEDASCQEANNTGTAFDSYRIAAITFTLLACCLISQINLRYAARRSLLLPTLVENLFVAASLAQ